MVPKQKIFFYIFDSDEVANKQILCKFCIKLIVSNNVMFNYDNEALQTGVFKYD